MIRDTLLAIARDETGVSIVEFAFIAPILVMLLMGLFDLTYNFYADTMVEGAVQEAARNSTIEHFAQNPAALDSIVEAEVRHVLPRAAITFERKAYRSYGDVGQAEDFTDTNGDGICNGNEPFEDANNNGIWDSDRSLTEASGARDAVLYTVTATYDRQFPLASMFRMRPQNTVRAVTVLRNQPYNMQDQTTGVGNCS